MHVLTTPEQASQWLRTHVTGTLHTDSRKVGKGDGFIAWPGAAVDGRQYVQAALAAGAAACIVEGQAAQSFGFTDERIARYDQLKPATGMIAAHYYQQPSQQLDVIAITGTNGKTSTAWWVAQALNTLRYGLGTSADQVAAQSKSLSKSELLEQYSSGLVGTLGVGIPGKMVFNGNSTPDPVLLQAAFAHMVAAGAKACAIEATSIGLAEQRLAGVAIKVAVFTNFTQDHLDYHGSMQDYWLAKLALFDWPGLRSAVVNVDDAKGVDVAAHCAARGVQVWTVSQLRTDTRLWVQNITYTDTGMQFVVREGADSAQVQCTVVGDYNISNLLCAIGCLRSLEVPLAAACEAVSQCTAVPGRMECIALPNAPLVAVDYAHTPDALEKVLQAMRPMARARSGQLWCVFGCGGDRDTSKRPVMASIAERNADKVVVTSDNPRSEAPDAIIAQIVAGLSASSRAQVQTDRASAISQAVLQAGVHDVVVIAGKGHEDYQDIAGVKLPFSDKAQAQAALAQRAGKVAA
jgi:UDP-N-acetylmuramyl-tripeptide synthetase